MGPSRTTTKPCTDLLIYEFFVVCEEFANQQAFRSSFPRYEARESGVLMRRRAAARVAPRFFPWICFLFGCGRAALCFLRVCLDI